MAEAWRRRAAPIARPGMALAADYLGVPCSNFVGVRFKISGSG